MLAAGIAGEVGALDLDDGDLADLDDLDGDLSSFGADARQIHTIPAEDPFDPKDPASASDLDHDAIKADHDHYLGLDDDLSFGDDVRLDDASGVIPVGDGDSSLDDTDEGFDDHDIGVDRVATDLSGLEDMDMSSEGSPLGHLGLEVDGADPADELDDIDDLDF